MPSFARIVLCVDDDADDREVIHYTIAEIDASLKVVLAENGVQAIEFLSKAKEASELPCLVILDINMPIMDGKQTLAEIKKDAVLCEVPVVVFSTSNNLLDQMYWERYGVKLMTKPSSVLHMQQEVKQLLKPCVER